MSHQVTIENEYLRQHPVSAAEQFERLPNRTFDALVPDLDPVLLAVAMEYLSPVKALAVFAALSHESQLLLLDRAGPRLAVTLLAELSATQRQALLEALPKSSRDDLERLLAFPEDSAGRLMDRAFMGVRANMTVGETLQRLKESSLKGARSLFVVTPGAHLEGLVDIQDLALASPDDALRDYVQSVKDVVTTAATREELVNLLDRSRKDSVPVVDADGRLMGVVRYRNLFHAIEDVATADMQKMVGVSPEERALSLPGFAIRRRLPWLHINLVTAFLAASVVGLFEGLIAQFTALAILLPVVAGQSGNAGAQALAVTMRGLALREIGIRQWRLVLGKEVMIGLFNGVALAVTCGLAVYLWSDTVGLGIVIGIAMIMSMLAAGIAGSLVPIILTRLGQDPATASSIILTTITDVAGFFSFLGTATLLAFTL